MNLTTMISRRKFIRKIWAGTGAAALYAAVPMMPPEIPAGLPNRDPAIKDHPYWLRVLSKGVEHIPDQATIGADSWSDADKKEKAYFALDLAIGQNQKVVSGQVPASEKSMKIIVNNYKTSQFLLEKVQDKYTFADGFPQVTFHQDPARARLFYDLSSFILNAIIGTVDELDFEGFSDFDIDLLHAAEGYLRKGIETNQNAYQIAPDRFKTALSMSIGTGYNNLGLTLNFLGEIEQARQMYHKARALNPNDDKILKNLTSIYQNASYIQQGRLRF